MSCGRKCFDEANKDYVTCTECPKPRDAKILDELRLLRQEVNCRIEHGDESGGHLNYVRLRLDKILGRFE